MNRRTEQELVLQALRIAWMAHPALRLGQLIQNACYEHRGLSDDCFYTTDAQVLDDLRMYNPGGDDEPRRTDGDG